MKTYDPETNNLGQFRGMQPSFGGGWVRVDDLEQARARLLAVLGKAFSSELSGGVLHGQCAFCLNQISVEEHADWCLIGLEAS